VGSSHPDVGLGERLRLIHSGIAADLAFPAKPLVATSAIIREGLALRWTNRAGASWPFLRDRETGAAPHHGGVPLRPVRTRDPPRAR